MFMNKEIFTDKSEIPSKSGRLIIVCGRSGCGKTTLVGKALAEVNDLKYLKTYTTRKPRTKFEIDSSYEYEFVTKEQYNILRKNHPNWDHSDIYGESYGADIDSVCKVMQNGSNVIVNSMPSIDSINDLKKKYDKHAKVVAVDVDINIVSNRIVSERPQIEMVRLITDALSDFDYLKREADSVFIPSMNLDQDVLEFCNLIKSLTLA